MAKQTINLGTAPTGVGGDTPRSANLKAISNFDELYAALGATGSPAALPAALPLSNGGTGTTSIGSLMSVLMAAGAYTKSNITGLVSQVAGLPAGAILEYGINVNGAFLKLAGGVMICWAVNRQVTFANASNLLFAWTFPVNFVGNNPIVLVNTGGTLATVKSVGTVNCYSRTLGAANCALLALGVFVAGDVSGVFVDALAIGRWTNEG